MQRLDFHLHLGPRLEKTFHFRQMLLVSQSLDLALRYVNLRLELGSKHLQLPNLLDLLPEALMNFLAVCPPFQLHHLALPLQAAELPIH